MKSCQRRTNCNQSIIEVLIHRSVWEGHTANREGHTANTGWNKMSFSGVEIYRWREWTESINGAAGDVCPAQLWTRLTEIGTLNSTPDTRSCAALKGSKQQTMRRKPCLFPETFDSLRVESTSFLNLPRHSTDIATGPAEAIGLTKPALLADRIDDATNRPSGIPEIFLKKESVWNPACALT